MATKKQINKTDKNISSQSISMEELLAKSGLRIKSFQEGDEIEAEVSDITPQTIMFNIGGKSEGVLTGLLFDEVRDLARNLKVGDKVQATVVDAETREGYVRLSLKQYAANVQWDGLYKAQKDNKALTGIVKSISDKGMVVAIPGNMIGFVPLSHIGRNALEKGDKLVESEVKLKIVELDPNRGRVVLSEKAVSEADQLALEKEAISNLKEGEIYKGEVTQLTNFGAFVKIDASVSKKKVSIEGLVHISEISWDKIDKAENRLKVGDKVEVKVLDVSQEEGRVSLSIKQAKKDPWDDVETKYPPESKHTGKVVKQSSFGIFIELEPGVEGLLHMTKIPPSTEFKKGQDVSVYIEEVDANEHKIALGLVLTTKPVAYK